MLMLAGQMALTEMLWSTLQGVGRMQAEPTGRDFPWMPLENADKGDGTSKMLIDAVSDEVL